MTYGVVITLLVLALIATVIAITVTSNQPATAELEPIPEPDLDAASTPPVMPTEETLALVPSVVEQPVEEIAQPYEREIADVPEAAADDTRSVRL